ncbi:MAG: PAS domain S-box protein, partial [Pseudomonadota bacterium]
MQPTYKTLAESNKQLELEILNRNYIEQTLKLINNRFDLVLDSSDIGFYDWNLTTDQIYYSPQWKKILGYEDNEIKEDLSEWTMRASKEGQAFILQMSRGMIDGEQGWFEKEFQMVHKHGHMVDILSRSKVLRDETGDAVRMVGVHLDISDRKKKQLLLKASEEKFSKIFHQSLLLMSISSIEDGQYIEVNDYFADLTGYSREEAIGNTSVNLGIIDAADRDRIKQGLLADGYVQDLELTLHKKDGDVFYAIYCGIIITINEQKRLLSCVSDITQRKTMEIELIQKQEQQHQAMAEKQALEKQLLQLQKIEAIGALAGGIAHD